VVNTHGGGIIQVCDTFYMHGLYFGSPNHVVGEDRAS
jgi:hypothetical protein